MAVRLTTRSLAAFAGIGLSVALLVPAQAQFWDWGRPQRIQRFDPFRDIFGGFPRYRERDQDRDRGGERERTWDREAPADPAHAPTPAQKKPDATIPILVLGDANADWLAYGLEDAFAEKPELNVVRKHRTDSGLIRYDPRREGDWAQAAREIIAAEKPKFIIMMVGSNDRQTIREKAVAPAPPRPASGKPGAAVQQQAPAQPTAPAAAGDPDQQPPGSPATGEQASPNAAPDQARTVWYSFEFHTEKWEIAYIKRVDATIATLKSAGVPVIWVGLPSQRGAKASADSSYLNEIYRSRAEKAGITYVDIWDGFVDDGGRFSFQGPDYEGQIRRLRSGDGVYFTKFGARKLALYVEREIQRQLVNHPIPVALPAPADAVAPAANVKPGGSSQRPNVGPVIPLTAPAISSDELLGGSKNRPVANDASANRVLTRGEAITPPNGRADDFSWPRSTVNIETTLEPTPASAPIAGADNPATKKPVPGDRTTAANSPNSPAQRRAPSGEQFPFRLPFSFPFFR